MMKKYLSVLIVLVIMLLSVCSCSGEKKNTSSPASSEASESNEMFYEDSQLDQVLLGVRLGMTKEEIKEKLGKEYKTEDSSICFFDFTILDFRFDRLQYFMDEEGKLDSIEYWLEGTGVGNTKIQTRDFSRNVQSVFGDPVESEVTLAWFQKWNLGSNLKISVGHNFDDTFCTVNIEKIE